MLLCVPFKIYDVIEGSRNNEKLICKCMCPHLYVLKVLGILE